MRIFELAELQYSSFKNKMVAYLQGMLNAEGEQFGANTVFGQMITVLQSIVQNMLLYLEDSMAEQNKYTAQRKKSIYGLAKLSGYEPSLGKAASGQIRLSFKPSTTLDTDIVIPDHTAITCSDNGLVYNIVLPQETAIISTKTNNQYKTFTIVEGSFESQTYVSTGGELYTMNVTFQADMDLDYLVVEVNDEVWTRQESLYDCSGDGMEYVAHTALKSGIDLVFGNNQYGRALSNGDVVKVTYLLHSGEVGNVSGDLTFAFVDTLTDINGSDVDGNQSLSITSVDEFGLTSGTYSESASSVAEMIGFNSRSLVLADPNNYKIFLNKFSFVGYNRTWGEEGTYKVYSMVMKNFKLGQESDIDYFSLSDDDFILSDTQKESIKDSISNSGQQLVGVTFDIIDPTICKYAAYIYVTLTDEYTDQGLVSNKILTSLGEYMNDIDSDIFIPKSVLIKKIKDDISEINSVDIYFLSERNEEAIKNGYYTQEVSTYDATKNVYVTSEEKVYIYDTNPNIGLDSHGNILLEDNDKFPVLMGGWEFVVSESGDSLSTARVTDAVTIIYE